MHGKRRNGHGKGRCYVMLLFPSLFFFFFFVVFFSFVVHHVGGWVGGSVVQFGLMFDTSLLVRHTVDLEAWGMFYSFFVFFFFFSNPCYLGYRTNVTLYYV
ncbi:uncharacterized protein B0T23DRAFT_182983 [Neurospora hispaniola]|uniref:Transmembrane protein n=1 Tax=Neurospora hispaniola TaxID=588809 RepID=A0AAJ0MNX7_9PEZI|nr:hypothetical protein B0T23DRAFT_182983 [Neurospora hispaniola]